MPSFLNGSSNKDHNLDHLHSCRYKILDWFEIRQDQTRVSVKLAAFELLEKLP